MKLSEVKKNGKVKIIEINKDNFELYNRFISFGLVEQKTVIVKNCSTFKTNIEILLDNTLIALRVEEAEQIEVIEVQE
jgi:Fe2+ transport system protein FeoA